MWTRQTDKRLWLISWWIPFIWKTISSLLKRYRLLTLSPSLPLSNINVPTTTSPLKPRAHDRGESEIGGAGIWIEKSWWVGACPYGIYIGMQAREFIYPFIYKEKKKYLLLSCLYNVETIYTLSVSLCFAYTIFTQAGSTECSYTWPVKTMGFNSTWSNTLHIIHQSPMKHALLPLLFLVVANKQMNWITRILLPGYQN